MVASIWAPYPLCRGRHHCPFGLNVFPARQYGNVPDSDEFDARLVRTFRPREGAAIDESRWPASVPAVAQLLTEGLELPAGLTVLVGENGSGKSTVVESLAEAYGLNPQGGSAHAELFRVRESEPGVGHELTVVRGQFGAKAALVLFPARRHDGPALHLPGAEPGPEGRTAA